MLRYSPLIALLVLAVPVLCGLAGTVLPAFGYLPALGGEDFSLLPFEELFSQTGIWRSISQSFFIGVISTALSVMLVAGFVSAWYGTRLFKKVQYLVSPLLSVPHAAAAFGFAFMIAPSGFFARLFSPWLTGWERPLDLLIVNDQLGLALIAGLVVKEVPFLLLVTLAALPQIAAIKSSHLTQSLGYGRMAGFLLSTWPSVYRQIRLPIFAVIAYASANVDMAIILGPATPYTLPVRLVGWMNDPDLKMRFMACAGACVQIAVTAFALLVWILIERFTGAASRSLAAKGNRYTHDWGFRVTASVLMTASALIVFGGLLVLALWSVSGLWQFPNTLPNTLSFKNWMRALPGLSQPLITTVIIGAASVAISIIISLACLAREQQTGRNGGNRALLLLYLPLLVPQIGFLFGLQLLLLSVNAIASWTALILVHVVFVLPYVFLSLSAPWRAFDKRYDSIGAALGSSNWRIFWRIRTPMLLRAILAACAVGFAVSIGQYLPTLLIGAGRFPTITTEAVALGSGGNRRIIGIYAFMQMMLPFIGFLLASTLPALIFRNRRGITGL
ncbi:ABC transporter permease [Ahrensia sp. 13_GOM-1096m]|uniref:ABC transporter permease n=1 Tax=Ahrensia sp. 13_GOM-1096m TaxID=1380380 RepID=UPI00047E37DD|nr:ABC transporter permease subunit [Ahrensia sp. 13_GOM-1096m]